LGRWVIPQPQFPLKKKVPGLVNKQKTMENGVLMGFNGDSMAFNGI